MFKTIITAALFATVAATANASISDSFDIDTSSLTPPAASQTVTEEAAIDTAYYCEWVTVYDYYGNWVTLWQCY
ncbi:hypothetical protein RIdsm_00614 [Roseovarius indicus]|uniref:Uncharacterized protein n=1 Tax=Roseovarius indicus TaxID=540747 RepID=A0A5P3A8D0_9RHOB|nr:hypothetical protein [Roseovarius indicus]QEW24830.1 hypothetical protein RIdsm_00614 [Roseovarius indicus]SFE50605.1 hypothetical protein SAMN04488031_11172 [Roseovarius indicus]